MASRASSIAPSIAPPIEHERELIRRFQTDNSDSEALAAIWQCHKRFVWQQAVRRRKHCTYIAVEDLLQVGFLKLRYCVLRLDLANGSRLSTYSYRAISRAMGEALRTNGNIYVPAGAHARKSTAAAAKLVAGTQSLDQIHVTSLGADGRQAEGSWLDQRCAASDDPAVLTADSEALPILLARLRAAITALKPRWRDVICRRMSGERMVSIGAAIGVTKARVQQIERVAIKLLREQLADCEHLLP